MENSGECPCKECICLAICKHKKLTQIKDCAIINEYIENPWKHGGFRTDSIEKINKALDRRFYIATGSYGYEFLKDHDDPMYLTKNFREFMEREHQEGKSGK